MVSIERLSFRGAGITLAADAAGPAEGQPVLFLHGGGQTRQSWGGAVKKAAERGYRAISLDLRGHGDSEWSPDGAYELDLFAADLKAVLGQIATAPILVGASLGGILGMLAAASPPPAVRALVLVDVTPRIEMEGITEIRAFMTSARGGFASLEEAADAVAAYLPHRPRPKDTSGLGRNLRIRNGRYHWHWDPAYLSMGEDFTKAGPLEERLKNAARTLEVPTLLVRGGRSRVVSEAGAREFRELVPHAGYVDIAGAHHMVAGDANDAFNDAIFTFLDKQSASS